MSRKATITLVGIALALMVFVAIYVPLRTGGQDSKAVGTALFNFDPDDVRGLKITKGDESFELKRGDFNWRIGPEPNDLASLEAVKSLIESARRTIVLDRIDAREISDRDQLSEYGLRKSRLQLDFKGDGDPPLLIGKDAIDEKRVYVRFENSQDVYLVSNEWLRILLRPPQDFRDHKLTSLHPARVDRLVLRRAGGEMELKRDAQGWRIIKPLAARANDAAITTFLDKVLRLRIESFISDKESDPGQFGLAEPIAEMRLFGEGDKDPQVIRIGSRTPEGGVYAQLSPRNILCRLPLSARDLLATDLTSFRDLSLARINPDLVDMIRFSTPKTSFSLRRNKDSWELDDGSRHARASSIAVQRMMDAFTQAKSIRFDPSTVVALEKNGLNMPILTVNFFSVVSENTPESSAGEQTILELQFAAPLPDGTVPIHAVGSSEIAFVSANVLEAVPSDPAAWIEP